MKYNNVE